MDLHRKFSTKVTECWLAVLVVNATFSLRVLVSLMIFFSLSLFSVAIYAAEKIEGIAVYEVLSKQGKQMTRVEESFEAIVDGKYWKVATRLIKLDPPSQHDQFFCPPYQEAGSDNEDCYYLKSMRVGGTNKLVGWIEPGVVPTITQSPTVALLWMGFCAGSYLAEETNSLRPIWVGGIDNHNRQDKCAMPVLFERNSSNPRFLEKLYYLCDGRANPCEPKDEKLNFMPPPWNNGFTQAVFQVQKTYNNLAIAGVPEVFRFDTYSHFGPPGGIDIRLQLRSSISAVVTNLTSLSNVSAWLPKIPEGVIVGVKDYRFTAEVTNWDAVTYLAIGNWRAKSNQEVTSAVKVFAMSPKQANVSGLSTKKAIGLRFLVAVSVGLPLVCIGFTYYNKKHKNNVL